MQEPKSVYVQKMVETIDHIDSKTALPFIETLERIDADKLGCFIDMVYDGKEHLQEVLHAIETCLDTPGSSNSAYEDD